MSWVVVYTPPTSRRSLASLVRELANKFLYYVGAYCTMRSRRFNMYTRSYERINVQLIPVRFRGREKCRENKSNDTPSSLIGTRRE